MVHSVIALNTRFRAIACGLSLAALCLAGAVSAQQGPALTGAAKPASGTPVASSERPHWKELSPALQTSLAPLKAEWDRMDALRKQKWIDMGNRFASMKPDEQQRMHERMRTWLKLTPEERQMARENYAMSKKLDKGQKSAQWEQYQQLPEEQKRKLAADAASKKQSKPATPTKPAPVINPPPGNPAAPAPNVK